MEQRPIEDLDYDLPERLIAQEPLADRAASRLLVIDRARSSIEEASFRRLVELLRPGDVLVRNDARVISARLRARTAAAAHRGGGGGGRVEVLLVEETPAGHWLAMLRPARRMRPGQTLDLPGDVVATVEEVEPGGLRLLSLPAGLDVRAYLERHGEVPLPPYIRAPLADPERYQTTYAQVAGAVAAPTAGLHFTPGIEAALAGLGVEIVDLTLHVGPGTFQPIRSSDWAGHRLHPERYSVPARAASALAKALVERRRIVAVGTTTVRVLESLGPEGLDGRPREGSTDLFIHAGFEFRVVGALLTNFHLPRTTLLALVMALAGTDLVKRAYRHAVEREFRFYSFGDACLIV
jgi:S-adenosylmethionine:tRNA ribosyltransferase-isomerase